MLLIRSVIVQGFDVLFAWECHPVLSGSKESRLHAHGNGAELRLLLEDVVEPELEQLLLPSHILFWNWFMGWKRGNKA